MKTMVVMALVAAALAAPVPVRKREGPWAALFQVDNTQVDSQVQNLWETPFIGSATMVGPAFPMNFPPPPGDDFFTKGFEKGHGLVDKEGHGLDVD